MRGSQKKISGLVAGVKRKKSFLWIEMLLVQWDNFPNIEESGSWTCGCVCFYSPGGKEVLLTYPLSCWLVGERGALQYICWFLGGIYGPYRDGVWSGPHTFPSWGQEGEGQFASGGRRSITMRWVGQWWGSGNSCLGQKLWVQYPWKDLEIQQIWHL